MTRRVPRQHPPSRTQPPLLPALQGRSRAFQAGTTYPMLWFPPDCGHRSWSGRLCVCRRIRVAGWALHGEGGISRGGVAQTARFPSIRRLPVLVSAALLGGGREKTPPVGQRHAPGRPPRDRGSGRLAARRDVHPLPPARPSKGREKKKKRAAGQCTPPPAPPLHPSPVPPMQSPRHGWPTPASWRPPRQSRTPRCASKPVNRKSTKSDPYRPVRTRAVL